LQGGKNTERLGFGIDTFHFFTFLEKLCHLAAS